MPLSLYLEAMAVQGGMQLSLLPLLSSLAQEGALYWVSAQSASSQVSLGRALFRALSAQDTAQEEVEGHQILVPQLPSRAATAPRDVS